MGKLLIYTALFGDAVEPLREPLEKIPKAELLCFTDRKDLKSDNWRIVHQSEFEDFFIFSDGKEAFEYMHPRLKARLLKIILPVRIKAYQYRVTKFFSKYDAQIYLWIDGSLQLLKDPTPLIDSDMKDADILAFKHPDRTQLEAEAHAAHTHRGVDLNRALVQVASCRARGFTSAEQTAITATGFLFRRHSPEIDFFNLSWVKELLLHTNRDQLSIDYCIWKHKIKRYFLKGSHRDNSWVKFFPHKTEKPDGLGSSSSKL